jgi:hypothetical protein
VSAHVTMLPVPVPVETLESSWPWVPLGYSVRLYLAVTVVRYVATTHKCVVPVCGAVVGTAGP